MAVRSRPLRARVLRPALLTAGAVAAALLAFAGSGSAASDALPTNTSPPTISGTEQQGRELTAARGSWTGNPTDYDYRWQRCNSGGSGCADVSGADSKAYTLGSADVGNRVRVGVTARNADGTSPRTYSGPTGIIAATATAPRNTSPPTISGTPQDNQTLIANNGSWSGTTPIAYRYDWQQCNDKGSDCRSIGARDQTYRVTSKDVGRRLRVVVTATNSGGTSSAVSAATNVATAAGAAPRNSAPPAIAGTPQDGQSLTASAGTWTGTAPITLTNQWLRCDANGNRCGVMGGATGSTYRATAPDVGHRLRVAITGRNVYGSSTATSGASAVIAAAGPAGAIKLPDGTTSIPITSVSPPDRLVVDRLEFNPPTIPSRTTPVTGRFRVVDEKGYVVRDVLVFAVGVPYNRVTVPPETKTDQSGWATLVFQPLRGLPMRKGTLLTIFVRARKPGESLLGGVSTRRLVSIRVRPS
jgi:hypothetical protein